jgi:hypothetical protein
VLVRNQGMFLYLLQSSFLPRSSSPPLHLLAWRHPHGHTKETGGRSRAPSHRTCSTSASTPALTRPSPLVLLVWVIALAKPLLPHAVGQTGHDLLSRLLNGPCCVIGPEQRAEERKRLGSAGSFDGRVKGLDGYRGVNSLLKFSTKTC